MMAQSHQQMNAMQTQVKGDDTCENMVAVCNHHASAKLVPSLSLFLSLFYQQQGKGRTRVHEGVEGIANPSRP